MLLTSACSLVKQVSDHSCAVHSGMRLGELIGSPPINSEGGHFTQCPSCATWIDCRNLGELLAHEDWCTRDHNTPPMPGHWPS